MDVKNKNLPTATKTKDEKIIKAKLFCQTLLIKVRTTRFLELVSL